MMGNTEHHTRWSGAGIAFVVPRGAATRPAPLRPAPAAAAARPSEPITRRTPRPGGGGPPRQRFTFRPRCIGCGAHAILGDTVCLACAA